MKINGHKIIGPNREIIAIPRGDDDAIIFIAEAVLDDSEFNKLCPPPEPRKRKVDGQDIPNLNDKNYIKNVEKYSEKRAAWMILQSLKATEGLEWERVNLKEPNTWLLYTKELSESGFSEMEIQRIINGCLTANGLNSTKIEYAKQHFLQVQRAKQELQSSHQVELGSMLSGEPANDSE